MTGNSPVAPKLSVVIPAFNGERTLGAQLEALARQDVPFAWEILVCDNGSVDGTVELVRRWMDRLPHLRLVDAAVRRGPAAARNIGARHARSPLLAFCDADDVVADDWVANIHACLQRDEFVAGVTNRIQLGSAPDRPQYYQFGPYRISHFPYLLAAAANNLAVRRSTFEQVGGFDESLRTGEDDDLCWRIQLAGHTLATRPEVKVTAGARQGLLALFAQAYGYGRGDRQLLHKYAKVVAALDANDGAIAKSLPAAGEYVIDTRIESANHNSQRPLMRRLKRIAHFRRPSDLAGVVHRLGITIGFRLGSFDRHGPQLNPEAVLDWSTR